MGFVHMGILDVIDIVLVAIIMFYIYQLTRGTYAPGILTGIIFIYILWVVVRALNMELLSAILRQVTGVGAIALIVVFQPEIRRFLHHIGQRGSNQGSNFFWRLFEPKNSKTEYIESIGIIVKACTDMAETKTGALIVIARRNDLRSIINSGIKLDAKVSTQLLKNIFIKNSPLHDGAVVILHNRIAAARCILPPTESEVPDSFGMRHRSGLGMSEVSDAAVIVISEETGSISFASQGVIDHDINYEKLFTYLASLR